MSHGLKTGARARRAKASTLLTALALSTWAVVGSTATAHSSVRAPSFPGAGQGGARAEARANVVPSPVRFQESDELGLLVRAWVNGAGPFEFALDTGAGATIISRRVAAEARVPVLADRPVNLSGLGGGRGASAREATLRTLALGQRENFFAARGLVVVADSLPDGLDGVLDPAEAFHPLGFVIDFPRETFAPFDPRRTPVRRADVPPDGAVVAWLTDGATRRPFVMLGQGRRALLDTGSGLGLAVTAEGARSLGIGAAGGRGGAGEVRDLGRGRVEARRVAAATVSVGPLVLRGVPTDLLTGASPAAPVLLGRDALRPFVLTFDPVNRLVRFAPG
jgi:predicted aspartyl protease